MEAVPPDESGSIGGTTIAESTGEDEAHREHGWIDACCAWVEGICEALCCIPTDESSSEAEDAVHAPLYPRHRWPRLMYGWYSDLSE